MKEIFLQKIFSAPLNLDVNKNHTIKYGNKSLRCLGPQSFLVRTGFQIFVEFFIFVILKLYMYTFLMTFIIRE